MGMGLGLRLGLGLGLPLGLRPVLRPLISVGPTGWRGAGGGNMQGNESAAGNGDETMKISSSMGSGGQGTLSREGEGGIKSMAGWGKRCMRAQKTRKSGSFVDRS